MIGSFGPTGPKFVTYSSAVAGVTAAMTSAAQAMEVERSSWTIKLVSFQFRPIRRESGLLQRTIEYRTAVTNLCCSAGQLVAGLMELKDGRRGWADMKATTADNTYTGKGGCKCN
jgi:hypothetical protein